MSAVSALPGESPVSMSAVLAVTGEAAVSAVPGECGNFVQGA